MVSAADMEKLGHLVTALREKQLRSSPQPDQKVAGYTSVILVIDENTSIEAHVPGDAKFEPKELQDVWDLIYGYEVGAW